MALSPETAERPNFLFIITDMQRRDSLGCYGNPVCRTPHLDRLAEEGVRFDNAFSANVVCMPSRVTLITGRYPRTHGVYTNGIPLSQDEITLPGALLEAGYATAATGKLHLSPFGSYSLHPDVPPYIGPETKPWHGAGRPMPMPYYGFQEVQMHTGDPGDLTHHYQELIAIDPKLPDLWHRENALVPPSGAPSSWKSAMPEEHSGSVWTADKAIAFMERFAQTRQSFFLHVGFSDPHVPYCPVAPWCDMYDPADVPMPNRSRDEVERGSMEYKRRIERCAGILPYHPLDMPEAHIREIIAHTYGMVSQIDANVGRMLKRLKELGLSDNTVVIFLTDHGEHLGDHWLIYKMCVFDELFHMPMLWRFPRGFPSGRRVGEMISFVDVMPTILELAGVAAPRGVQGESFAPALRGQDFRGRDAVLLEDDDEDNSMFERTLRTSRYRLSYRVPDNDGALFDLEEDPGERVNRWGDPALRRVKADLFERLAREMMYACDPKPLGIVSA